MLKHILFFIMLFLSTTAAGQIQIDPDPIERADGDWLVYDSGTFNWLLWDGTYRGVWFNLEDFIPTWPGVNVGMAECWFYHHYTSYPWDTSDFYCELWDGPSSGPVMRHTQVQSNAQHLTKVLVDFIPDPYADANFWIVINTEFSSGGWPSLIADDQNCTAPHSFFSDDFTLWEPWHIDDIYGNFLLRAWVGPTALERTSWGSIKAAF